MIIKLTSLPFEINKSDKISSLLIKFEKKINYLIILFIYSKFKISHYTISLLQEYYLLNVFSEKTIYLIEKYNI